MDHPHESTPRRARWLRIGTVATFPLAGLLFLLLPVAGAACGVDTAPMKVCVSGGQLATGEPSADLSNIWVPDEDQFADGIADQLGLSDARVGLVLLLLTVLATGALTALLPNPYARAAGGLSTAVVAAGLLVFLEIVVMSGMTEGASLAATLFSEDPGQPQPAGESVSTGFGFWLPLVVLVTVAFVYTYALLALKAAEPEDDWP